MKKKFRVPGACRYVRVYIWDVSYLFARVSQQGFTGRKIYLEQSAILESENAKYLIKFANSGDSYFDIDNRYRRANYSDTRLYRKEEKKKQECRLNRSDVLTLCVRLSFLRGHCT